MQVGTSSWEHHLTVAVTFSTKMWMNPCPCILGMMTLKLWKGNLYQEPQGT